LSKSLEEILNKAQKENAKETSSDKSKKSKRQPLEDLSNEILLHSRKELLHQLEFITNIMQDDREKLEAYYSKFNDLNYRPSSEDGEYGERTEILIVPMVTHFRTTVKAIVDSIAAIDLKINHRPKNPQANTADPDTGETPQAPEGLSAEDFLKAGKLLEEKEL
jgi:hypothetical protein